MIARPAAATDRRLDPVHHPFSSLPHRIASHAPHRICHIPTAGEERRCKRPSFRRRTTAPAPRKRHLQAVDYRSITGRIQRPTVRAFSLSLQRQTSERLALPLGWSSADRDGGTARRGRSAPSGGIQISRRSHRTHTHTQHSRYGAQGRACEWYQWILQHYTDRRTYGNYPTGESPSGGGGRVAFATLQVVGRAGRPVRDAVGGGRRPDGHAGGEAVPPRSDGLVLLGLCLSCE